MTSREPCCKIGCERQALAVLKLYTDEGPRYAGFCDTHLLLAGSVLEHIVQQNVMPDEETEEAE